MHRNDVTNIFPGYLAKDRVLLLAKVNSCNSNLETILQYGKGFRDFYHILKFYI